MAIGDVILKYGDDAPHDERALLRDIVKTPVGKAVNVVIQRDNNELTLPVTVAEWPRSKWEERDAPVAAERPNSRIPPDLGLSLAAIPTSRRASLGLEDTEGGVLVADVVPVPMPRAAAWRMATSFCAWTGMRRPRPTTYGKRSVPSVPRGASSP